MSKIAQFIDPICLLGPVIERAKLIVQQFWQSKTDWDESVPMELYRA